MVWQGPPQYTHRSTQTQKKECSTLPESVRAIDMAGRVMTLVANRDSEDSRPRECWRPLVGMSAVEVIHPTMGGVVLRTLHQQWDIPYTGSMDVKDDPGCMSGYMLHPKEYPVVR